MLAVPRGGHRKLPHSAEVMVSAWAPTREECVDQAVRGLVSCFADVPRPLPDQPVRFSLRPDNDAALLVGVLEEAIFAVDARGLIPVRTYLWSTAGGEIAGEFDVVACSAVRMHGRVPKAVTLNQLSLTDGGMWRCKIAVDI
jgi:SHS2 domain-containing protein